MDLPTPTADLLSTNNAASGLFVAQEAANMQAGLRRSILAAFTDEDDATVRGFSLAGSVDGKLWIGHLHFGQDSSPDLAVEIPADEAFVSCITSTQDTTALGEAWQLLVARIAAEAIAAPISAASAEVYEVQTALSGAGGAAMIAVLWRAVPPVPP